MVIKDNFDVVSGIVNKLGSSTKHVWMVCGSMWCLPGQDDSQWLDETHWPANRTPFLSSISSSGFLLVEVASDPWWQDLPNSQAACSWKGWTLVTDIELWTCTLPDLIIQTSALKLTCPSLKQKRGNSLAASDLEATSTVSNRVTACFELVLEVQSLPVGRLAYGQWGVSMTQVGITSKPS